MRFTISIVLISLMTGCASTDETQKNWDKLSYVDPTHKMNMTNIKSLSSPGIY